MFSYTISKNANAKVFEKACGLIESHFGVISKDKPIVDVDGTTIQIYHKGDKSIKVYDDYEVDAVYVDSDIELKNVF